MKRRKPNKPPDRVVEYLLAHAHQSQRADRLLRELQERLDTKQARHVPIAGATRPAAVRFGVPRDQRAGGQE